MANDPTEKQSLALRARLDLTPVGGAVTEFSGHLILDEIEMPRGLRLNVVGVPKAVLNVLLALDPEHKFYGKTVPATLKDGRLAAVQVAFLGNVQFTGAAADSHRT